MTTEVFQELIWQKGRELYRDMPWRADTNPYYILVSELMLQQTQVERVIPKFNAFIEAFPTVQALAAATLADVLVLWSGLGYNRRAKFLHEAAKRVVGEFDGKMPATLDDLVTLSGVGPNTAGAIMAYSFNQPIIFVETNIRSVYFHHFFHDNASITDKELRIAIEKTIDNEHPREWYWALMDYGTYLKRQGAGRITKSSHYKKQSALKGSVREIRGHIIKALTTHPMSESALRQIVIVDERFPLALSGLEKDGLISRTGGNLHLTK